jgi:integrase
LTHDAFQHKFKQILSDNNLPNIRIHDLRHSCASLLLKLGLNMKQIQEWLGHSQYSTTADIYTHLDMELKKEGVIKIDDFLKL